MKDKIFAVLQRVGRSFMLPIAILPVAGLLLGIGGSFTNETMLETYHLTKALGPGTVGNAILTVMSDAGNIVFANLPIIFAIGVAIGMAKKEKEVAALAAAIAFLIMHASIGAMITIHGGPEALLEGATTSVCGITSLQMGVFGGMIVGLGVASLHNKYYKIQLPQVLSFFGGTRFVPIVSGLVYTLVGIVMFFVWPFVQQGIYAVGAVVLDSGYFGTWVYGLMERLLIPFGLHHVFYLPFWQTAVGGTLEVGGQVIEGAQNIFFAQLADPTVDHFAVSATRFMSGKFPLMIFGLPGAALAMYRTALPEKRKEVGGLLLSAALTSMLTGITEPIEFTFLFVAPALYGIHCVFAGAAYMLMHMCGVGVGMTFSGGLIDLTLFGILPGNARTSWIWVPIVGVGYFVVYYFLFSFLIKKFDLKTPGRDAEEEVKLYRRSDYNAKKESVSDETSAKITNGLGGKKNISDVDCCATRLRCTVFKPELVNDALLKSTGASGVVHKGNGVQIIYGPHVTVIKSNLEDYLETAPNEEYNGANEAVAEEAKAEETAEPTGKLVKTVVLGSPLTGTAADLSETPDEVFAQKMMGDGAVITPADGKVYAPADGTVVFVFDTNHAIGFKTDDDVAMLLHFGIDTVKLKGEGFNVLVKAGQQVKKGDVLMEADLDFISKNAPSIATPVLCTELKSNQKLRRIGDGSIKAGEDLLAVDFYE
ncbi:MULTISPECIES: PTS transporter subunit IIABC [Pseudobutyrivibrio]|uniref:PTS system, D-glucosamine-specific IIC component n=1 Tax=Pseudobutyrivibrio ruminis TaxID=46206 RepID=A0A1H7GCM1_9FIRM|nr:MULTISPECIES: PTS transporter subunit IIABC [Pseudobutyrivibrio]SEK35869.1 PTS system, D-glucosamine-specific IIC component [Pseudobutyrivibrio ruminis]SES63786.1 PTS system, D-glucosamine-specific IIC component [Pseudobutyrivibrio sp. C4]SFO41625.1 PTS system IIA component, Glc family /PTS system IIB component, Glc family /PTS system IIC component, Glc family [Pseudobutyrivibrio sp. JW11]